MKKWLFNPFIYIAGAQALAIGFVFMIITAIICWFSQLHFNGLLQVNTHSSTFLAYFIEGFLCWAVPVLLFYIGGRLVSRSHIRLIDVAGTFALARWVLVFMAFTGF